MSDTELDHIKAFKHQCRECKRIEYVLATKDAETPRCCKGTGSMAFLGVVDYKDIPAIPASNKEG